MEYYAHIRSDGGIQTVGEHCKKTASLSEKYTEKMQLSYLAQLSGKLHDVGKLTADFMGYICGENSFRRGELDHSFAGARYICEAAKKPAQKG